MLLEMVLEMIRRCPCRARVRRDVALSLDAMNSLVFVAGSLFVDSAPKKSLTST
jgi:hypothetical protein